MLYSGDYFFVKKLAILPWAFPAAFFPLIVLAGFGAGFDFFGSGSSSEKDSQAASSVVTATA